MIEEADIVCALFEGIKNLLEEEAMCQAVLNAEISTNTEALPIAHVTEVLPDEAQLVKEDFDSIMNDSKCEALEMKRSETDKTLFPEVIEPTADADLIGKILLARITNPDNLMAKHFRFCFY